MIKDIADAEIPAAAQLAAAAYRDDPGFAYVLPDDAQRRLRLPALMEGLLRGDKLSGARLRGAYDEGALVGVSAVLPAGATATGFFAYLRLLPSAIWLASNPPAALRAASLADSLERLRRDDDDYLRALAVHPAAQGRGVGAALLRDALQTDKALYANTFDNGGAAWFEKRGFSRVSEVRSAQRPTFWTLRRAAAAGA